MMDPRQAQDNRRLARSALAAAIFHAAVFMILAIIVAVNGAPSAERIGLITLTLDERLPPGPPSPVVTPRADERNEKAVKAPEPPKAVATAEKSVASAKSAPVPEKDGSVREPVAKKTDGAKPPADALPSRLEEGSLSKLDAVLKDASAKTGTDAGNGGGKNGAGDPRSTTRWEDNAVRELIFQAAPVIPRWVSEQGLRLRVELSVELNADGLVIIRGVKVSSGYPDVDAAVAKAVSRWKYTRGTGAQSVRGVIAYFITPR